MEQLISLSKAETSSLLAASEYALLAFALLIVIGLVGEYRLPWYHHRLKIFEIAVAIGCGGELLADGGIFLFSRHLEALSDIEVRTAMTAASNADSKRVELVARILDVFGPRTLGKAQSERIRNNLSSLAGLKVDVFAFAVGNPWSESESEESKNLARSITGALIAAHVDAIGWIAGSCHGAGASNLVVSIPFSLDAERQAASKQPASKLIEALSPEIATFPEVADDDPSMTCEDIQLLMARSSPHKPGGSVNIVVGRKIPPLLTPEILGLERPVMPAKN